MIKGQIMPETMQQNTPAPVEKKNWKRELLEWGKAIAIALLVTIFLKQVILVNALVPSTSMQPGINPGDRIIGLRTAYWFSEPQRGDIVIFKYPDDESILYIKRVIGLPGETVTIADGAVYINGEKLEEGGYLAEKPRGNFGPYTVPEESYFMLGDNRNVSRDARYWHNTFVHRSKILAKATVRVYPSPQFLQ